MNIDFLYGDCRGKQIKTSKSSSTFQDEWIYRFVLGEVYRAVCQNSKWIVNFYGGIEGVQVDGATYWLTKFVLKELAGECIMKRLT